MKLRPRSLRPDLVLVNSAIAAAPWPGALQLLRAHQEWHMALKRASFLYLRPLIGPSELVS